MMSKNSHIIITMLFWIGTICSQVQKKKMQWTDADKWNTLTNEQLSPDAKWISYILDYDTGIDTLFIQNVKTGKKIAYPDCIDATFSGDSKHVKLFASGRNLLLRNLNTGTAKSFNDIVKAEFFNKGKFLVALEANDEKKGLRIVNLNNDSEHFYPGILSFSIHEATGIVGITSNSILLLQPQHGGKFTPIAIAKDSEFSDVVWSANGNTLAFMEKSKGAYNIGYCQNVQTAAALQMLDSKTFQELKDRCIDRPLGSTALDISADGNRIIFHCVKEKPVAAAIIPEVWDSETVWEYPREKIYGNYEYAPMVTVWIPKQDKIVQAATQGRPVGIFTADYRYFVAYHLQDYEPQYDVYGYADFYITNIETGATTLLAKKQNRKLLTMGASPDGRFISYFDLKNWWVYDTRTMKHSCLTDTMGTPLTDVENDRPSPSQPYGTPDWTSDGKAIIYDRYDIWLMSPDGKNRQRITDGFKHGITYRLSAANKQESKVNSFNFVSACYNTDNGLVLESQGDDKATGYFYWNKRELQKLFYTAAKNSRLKKAHTKNAYIFISETAVSAPKLMFLANGRSEVLLRSNAHEDNFEKATVRLISYTDARGNNLQGKLYYPTNFSIGKTYPMIVSIYERQSYLFHSYSKPTQYDSIGFSPLNYASEGYLVLYPDITYQIGEPGRSAVDCVESAVKAVIKLGIADTSRIGLIGHSYGGYEASFIITQSKMFAAAVAGAGVTDMVSGVLEIRAKQAQNQRYESGQHRIGKSLYENYGGYIENSPIAQAIGITTPLLTWHGKQDGSVKWEQSLEMHLALRRLGKKHTMLIYPGEGHALAAPEACKDLSDRIHNWFDYYLKGIGNDILGN
ncbi:MAG: S9 family peptidase [Flavobacterium sp.]|uniref:S9 family peptidase n=1 Tax=Flavobacterium sp. TaxID=239 RepID=UPI001B069562|nr:prolyl oligopeptidase family serine peptidase [Flavobacterium sp.]MBO9584414.1 S9 family peptidase [Flavobacterium sp.]